jgi:hypothetical protein
MLKKCFCLGFHPNLIWFAASLANNDVAATDVDKGEDIVLAQPLASPYSFGTKRRIAKALPQAFSGTHPSFLRGDSGQDRNRWLSQQSAMAPVPLLAVVKPKYERKAIGFR